MWLGPWTVSVLYAVQSLDQFCFSTSETLNRAVCSFHTHSFLVVTSAAYVLLGMGCLCIRVLSVGISVLGMHVCLLCSLVRCLHRYLPLQHIDASLAHRHWPHADVFFQA